MPIENVKVCVVVSGVLLCGRPVEFWNVEHPATQSSTHC